MAACTPPLPATLDPDPTAARPAADKQEARAIVFGDISDDPGEVIEGTQPMADYVAGMLGDYGVTEGQVRIAGSTDEMIELLTNGEVDLYFDSIYPATLIADASGAEPILRRWRFGVEEYYTIIYASKASGVTSIEELSGHIVAMDSPYSTSGYAIPAVFLVESGLTLVGKENYNEGVADDEVGFVYSYDDDNSLQWVLSGFVSAGVTDDFRFNVLFPEEAREELVILAETDRVPRQVMIARAGLDNDLLAAIIEVLLNADEDPEAAAALEAFQTSQFDEFPDGVDDFQNDMRALVETLDAIPAP
jgi:phosphonate transport system substrate-binding protein